MKKRIPNTRNRSPKNLCYNVKLTIKKSFQQQIGYMDLKFPPFFSFFFLLVIPVSSILPSASIGIKGSERNSPSGNSEIGRFLSLIHLKDGITTMFAVLQLPVYASIDSLRFTNPIPPVFQYASSNKIAQLMVSKSIDFIKACIKPLCLTRSDVCNACT